MKQALNATCLFLLFFALFFQPVCAQEEMITVEVGAGFSIIIPNTYKEIDYAKNRSNGKGRAFENERAQRILMFLFNDINTDIEITDKMLKYYLNQLVSDLAGDLNSEPKYELIKINDYRCCFLKSKLKDGVLVNIYAFAATGGIYVVAGISGMEGSGEVPANAFRAIAETFTNRVEKKDE